jgi:hypothetical protein
MTHEEMLDAVQRAIADGRLSLADIAGKLGMSVAALESAPGHRLVMAVMSAGVDVGALVQASRPGPPSAAPASPPPSPPNGGALAEAIGSLPTEEPLAGLLAAWGVPTDGNVTPVEHDHIDLHFIEGRLVRVGFEQGFEGALPFDLTWEEPLPAGFTEDATGSLTLDQEGLRLQFLTDDGMRFHLSVTALDPTARRPRRRPLFSVPTAAPPPPPKPPPTGIHVGYKTAWLAVRSDDVSGIAEAIGAREPASPCTPRQGIDGGAPFISASRDGWRLVLWSTDDVPHGLGKARHLSRVLKTTAGFFASDRVIDQYAWSRFDEGVPVRVFWAEDGTTHRDEGHRRGERRGVDEQAVERMAETLTTAPLVPEGTGTRFTG